MPIDINIPAQTDTTTETRTQSGTIMSPQVQAAMRAEDEANAAAALAEQKKGEALTLQEAVRADQAANATDLAHQQAADQAAERQAYIDRQQAARDAAQAAEDAFANHTYHDYWSDKKVGTKLADGFGLFLGGVGHAYLGQPNYAAEALYRDMDRDFEKQKAQAAKLKDRAAGARQNVNDLYTQEAHENAAMAIKFAKANEATAAEMVQRLAEAGVPLKEAETNSTVAGLRARAQEQRRQALQHYDRAYSNTIASTEKLGGDKGPPESQAKTSLTAEQMADSLKIIKENPPLSQKAMAKLKNNELAMQAADTDAGKGLVGNATVRAGRMVGAIPESKYQGLDETEQKVANAWDNVKELYVRQFTGAGMPETEALRAAEQYGPRPGDSPALVQQKFERQERMVAQMRAQSPSGTAAMQRAGIPQEGAMDVPTARKTLSNPNASFDERKKAARAYEGAAREKRGGAKAAPQQQVPIGARATSGGRPIIMTESGWQYVQ